MKTSRLISHCLLGVAVGFIWVPLAVAQGQGGGSTGGGGGGGTTGGGGGGTRGGTTGGTTGGQQGDRGTGQQQQQQDPFGRGQQQQQQFPEMQRPMFLQGKVIFQDGSPVPPNVVIERVCGGRPIPEDYTDTKGRFSFQVGQNQQMVSDASYSGNGDPFGRPGQNTSGQFGGMGSGAIGERELMGCELRAALPGYRSSSVELSGRRMFDNPDVGTLILTKIAGVEGLTISMTTLHAPKNAKKAYEKGVKEAQKQKWDKAETELVKAVTIYPEYAMAWETLGRIYEGQEKTDEARDAYSKALAADDKFVSPYIRIALMDAKLQKWQEVADTTGRVLKLNPFDFPDAYFYNSVANLNLKQLTAAEKSAREAIKLNAHQKFPQVENVLGIALAQQGNFVEATEHLKKYLEIAPEAANAEVTRQQITQLEAAAAQQQPQAQAQPQQ